MDRKLLEQFFPIHRSRVCWRGKKGSYDAYLIQEGIEDYNYTKDGRKIKGSQYKVKLEFSKEK